MLPNFRRCILVCLITSAAVANAAPPSDELPPPFQLTPWEQAECDHVLRLWDEHSAKIQTLQCRFRRWCYDPVFGPTDAPRFDDIGAIAYAAPDRGMYRLDRTVISGHETEIEPDRAEHWICDGKVLYEYRMLQKQLVRLELPTELRETAIVDWSLPFTLFLGGKAESLKRYYHIRLVTPPDSREKTWIEFYPKNATWWRSTHRITLILASEEMRPYAMQIIASNGKQRTVYQFFNLTVNEPPDLLGKDPLDPVLPFGWTRVSIATTDQENEPLASVEPAEMNAARRPICRRWRGHNVRTGFLRRITSEKAHLECGRPLPLFALRKWSR